ncbi:MAG: hypothetical protein AAGD23_13375 [Pseudomonadota bacterium]
MSTATLKSAGFGAGHGERSLFSGSNLMDRLSKGATRTFENMIAARERAAMVAVRRYAEQAGIDLDVVRSEMARTMGSDEDTPRNLPKGSRTAAGRVTRF